MDVLFLLEKSRPPRFEDQLKQSGGLFRTTSSKTGCHPYFNKSGRYLSCKIIGFSIKEEAPNLAGTIR